MSHRNIVHPGKSQEGREAGRSPSFLQAQVSCLNPAPALECLQISWHELVRGLLHPSCSLLVYHVFSWHFSPALNYLSEENNKLTPSEESFRNILELLVTYLPSLPTLFQTSQDTIRLQCQTGSF